MLVSLVVGATLIATGWPFNEVSCPSPPTRAVSSATPSLSDSRWSFFDKTNPSPTTVRDPWRFPANAGAGWIPVHAGGAHNGHYVVVDTHAHMGTLPTYVTYECGYDDTVREMFVMSAGGVPRRSIREAIAKRPITWRTPRGIELYVAPDDVRRIYGPAPLQKLGEFLVLSYEERRLIPGTNTVGVVKTVFLFRNAGLFGVGREAGV